MRNMHDQLSHFATVFFFKHDSHLFQSHFHPLQELNWMADANETMNFITFKENSV